MVKVNLLPADASKKKQIVSPTLLGRAVLFVGAATLLFLVAGILLRVVNFARAKAMPEILSQFQQAQDFANKIRAIKTQENELNAEIEFLNRYLGRDISWSGVLVQLRELIPEQVWLKNLSFEKMEAGNVVIGKLYLRGGLITLEKESPLELLSVFMNKLKTDIVFSKNFNSPVLADSHNENYNGKEIMAFSLELSSRE